MDLKTTRYDIADGVATLTLARPHRGNAWTGRMHTEYRWVLREADLDPDVRVVVVTGEGRAFCVGADSQALEGHVEKGGYDPGTPDELAVPGAPLPPELDANFAYQFGMKKPVIAAINGAAAGAGLCIACFADLRFAVPGAKLTTAHGKLALPAEFGLSWLLPRLIGLARANDLLLSSRIFLTEEAFELGLINRLLSPEDLLPETLAYAKRMAAEVSPGSLATTKAQIYRDLHRDLASAVRDSDALLDAMMREPDYKEAIRAFLDKRPARWGRPGGDK